MRQLFLLLLMIAVWSGFPAWASENASFEEEADTSSLKNQRISFAWENDLYYQHDYYFTNGFQIDIFHDWLRKSPNNRILIPTGKNVVGKRYSGLQLRVSMRGHPMAGWELLTDTGFNLNDNSSDSCYLNHSNEIFLKL